MRTALVALTVLSLAGCVMHERRPEPRPPTAPPIMPSPVYGAPTPVHPAEPIPGPSPAPMHPNLPLDPAGAASVAQQYAYSRGLPSEVKKVERRGDTYEVELKVKGPDVKGEMRVAVQAYTGAVSVLEEKLKAHDQGKHKGQGHGKGHGRDEDDDD